MELRHRILQLRNSPKYDLLKAELEKLGCKYALNENRALSSIEYTFSEHDSLSQHLLHFVELNDLYIQSALYYPDEEIRNAEWVIVEVGEFQYPQPEDSYWEATFDISDYCERCGQGWIQDKPFRLRKDFAQKQARFLGLYWVHDEIFVRPEIRRIFEKAGITGVTYSDVIHHKTDKVFENVLQMNINTVTEPGLITDDLFVVTCKPKNEESFIKGLGQRKDKQGPPFCGRIKYHYPVTKPIQFKASILKDLPDFAKSYEIYGSGGASNRFILARNRVVSLIKEKRLRGLGFRRPVHLV